MLTAELSVSRYKPVVVFWEELCAPLSKLRRTPAHHPHTAGLLPAALGLLLTHTCLPGTPAMKFT